MDLRNYVRAIRKSWMLVLLATLVGAGVAVGIVLTATPTYSSSVTFFASTPSSGGSSSYQADQYAQSRVTNYAKLLSSDRLGELILAKTGLPMSVGEVTSEISGVPTLNTVLLTATVIDPSPDRGLKITQAIATEFGTMVEELDGQTSANGSAVILNVTSGPTLNPVPVSPRKKLDIGLGIGAGLVLGLLIAVLREVLDTSVRTADDLRELTGHPVLGRVVFDPNARKTPLVTVAAGRSQRAEALRQVRTNLQFVDVDKPPRVVVVTSSVPEEGKSTTAANLAIITAEAGLRVLLVEADLRRPAVADYLGIERAAGLTNVLAGQVSLDDVLQPWGEGGLTILPSGSLPPNPAELLSSATMRTMVDGLRKSYDLVLIDTPPLLAVTDGAILSALADGVVLVVRCGKTAANQLTAALRSLVAVDATVFGSVLNMAPRKGPEGHYRYGRDGYYQQTSTQPVIPMTTESREAVPDSTASKDGEVPAQNEPAVRQIVDQGTEDAVEPVRPRIGDPSDADGDTRGEAPRRSGAQSAADPDRRPDQAKPRSNREKSRR